MASVGEYKQVVLEKWSTPKNAAGSLKDTLDRRYPIWADIRRRGGSRSYENFQTKLSDSKEVFIFWRSRFDINANWKIVYDGKRFTVLDVEKVNEKRFNYRLLIDSNGS